MLRVTEKLHDQFWPISIEAFSCRSAFLTSSLRNQRPILPLCFISFLDEALSFEVLQATSKRGSDTQINFDDFLSIRSAMAFACVETVGVSLVSLFVYISILRCSAVIICLVFLALIFVVFGTALDVCIGFRCCVSLCWCFDGTFRFLFVSKAN